MTRILHSRAGRMADAAAVAWFGLPLVSMAAAAWAGVRQKA